MGEGERGCPAGLWVAGPESCETTATCEFANDRCDCS